jgi:hypothetical protein
VLSLCGPPMSVRPSLHTHKRALSSTSEDSAQLAPLQRRAPSAHDESKPAASAAASSSAPVVSAPSAVVTPPIPPNSIGLRVLPSFLTRGECDLLISLSHGPSHSPLFARSLVGRPHSYVSASRTSHSAVLRSSHHPLVGAVLARIAAATGATVGHLEGSPAFDVLRYEVGERFDSHRDSTEGDAQPRRATMLIYLNDMPADAGGETRFPIIDVEFTPTCGTALTWSNCSDRQTVHEESLHQSLTVRRGVKYAINVFVFFDPK